jgi:hypothetical protein
MQKAVVVEMFWKIWNKFPYSLVIWRHSFEGNSRSFDGPWKGA